MTKFIFIIGTGRTATVFLKEFFRVNLPDAVSLHEPKRMIKLCSNMHLSGVIGKNRLEKYLRCYARAIARRLKKCDAHILVQVDPWLYGFTGLLDAMFENPYVIHIVRNPLTYIPSHLNRMYSSAMVGFLRDAIPYWKLRGDQTGDYTRGEWKRMTQEEKMAWYWRKCNEFIESESAGLTRCKRIRYEDLFRDNHSGLREIAAFCELSLPGNSSSAEGLEQNTAPASFPDADAWPPELRERVVRICRPLAERYGYVMAHPAQAPD